MQKLPAFLARKGNREILAWLGSGLVVLATGLWAVFTYVFPPQKSASTPAASPSVNANCGSVAVGGNVTGSQVAAGSVTAGGCPPGKPN